MSIENEELATREVYVIDALQEALLIEDALRQTNLIAPYPVGWYLPHRSEPSLVPEGKYWYEIVKVTTSVPDYYRPSQDFHNEYQYYPVADVGVVTSQPWDVVDREDGTGRVLVHHRELSTLRDKPYLPIYGLKILHESIYDEIYSTRAFETCRNRPVEEIVLPYTVMADATPSQVRDNPKLVELFNYLYDTINRVRSGPRNFIRGRSYAICSIDQHNSHTFHVHVKGDHRIHEWNIHRVTGKWP